MLESITEQMDSSNNYKLYRAKLRTCTPPALPYLGVYLTSLVFIDEGNKDNLRNMINFYKRRQLYVILRLLCVLSVADTRFSARWSSFR